MTLIAVTVTDGLGQDIPDISFGLKKQGETSFSPISYSYAGYWYNVYVVDVEDNATLQTSSSAIVFIGVDYKAYSPNETDLLTFPSSTPYTDPNNFTALQIVLDSYIVPGDKSGTPECFVATAAYDTPLAPNVQFLRELRDQKLKITRSGELLFNKFFEKYSVFAPDIVELMTNDPQMKEFIKLAFVNPIINYFRIVSQFPNESAKELKEPWKTFLLDAQTEYEKWVKEVLRSAGSDMSQNLWHDFSGMTSKEAAKEIETAVSYLFRSESSLEEYLSNLEKLNQIPIAINEDNERIDLAEKLSEIGLSQRNIKRITG
jgi:hypothetical protein